MMFTFRGSLALYISFNRPFIHWFLLIERIEKQQSFKKQTLQSIKALF